MTSLTTSVPIVALRPRNASFEYARSLFGVVRFWRERVRQRAALSELDDRLLRDIGVSRLEAQHESEKPFWR